MARNRCARSTADRSPRTRPRCGDLIPSRRRLRRRSRLDAGCASDESALRSSRSATGSRTGGGTPPRSPFATVDWSTPARPTQLRTGHAAARREQASARADIRTASLGSPGVAAGSFDQNGQTIAATDGVTADHTGRPFVKSAALSPRQGGEEKIGQGGAGRDQGRKTREGRLRARRSRHPRGGPRYLGRVRWCLPQLLP